MDVKKIREKMKNVPFGNSVFQIQHFISENTPERNYRNALLQLNAKLNAMQECAFRRKRKEIDIEEINEKILNTTGFTRKRLEIDLEEAQLQLENEIKLIEDCMVEIRTYESVLESLPDFTREEFEGAEKSYWEQRLLGDARRQIEAKGSVDPGFLESLEKIGVRIKVLPSGKLHVFGQIEQNTRQALGMSDLPEEWESGH